MSITTLPAQLLAKSQLPGGRWLSLEQHSFDTEEAARHLFRPDSRWGRNFCRFFRLKDPERFWLHVRVAALFHDLGKANEDFYNMVRSNGKDQVLRHEHLSAFLLHIPELRSWLRNNPSLLDVDIITAAVLSHHLKAAERGDWAWGQPQALTRTLRLFWDHTEIKTVLRRVAEVASLPPPDTFPFPTSWSKELSPLWSRLYKEGRSAAGALRQSIRKDKERSSLLLATKAGLIAADSAASGLVRERHSIFDWIEDVAHAPAITADDIEREILAPRAAEIERQNGGRPFTLHRFQEQAATQGSRVLLLAACGAGKTLAAWKWAAAQASTHAIGRVIFLYPTRGTATEGFRDYVGWAPETRAALVHSTSRYELEAIAQNPNEATRGKVYQDEADDRLFALGLWSKRYFSATVDQFLSFLEHSYKALCLLPALADSALILDEVHSYDRKLFDSLVSFLHHFDIPVLCMTATLPPSRQQELRNAGLTVYPTPAQHAELKDLRDKEEHPRYTLRLLSSKEEACEQALAAYRDNKRVLWVVNTVARCQEVAVNLQNKLAGERVLVYHSRFRLEDKQKRHQETVAAFQQKERRAIAVTTQVCEMSLDLDADVLITELAPVTSLVQRFGRANRKALPGDPYRAPIYIYPPESALPYRKEELNAADAFLKELCGRDINQRELAEALEKHASAERLADGSARFLDSGYFATPGQLRDLDERSVTCVLKQDLPRLQALLQAKPKRSYDGLLLPVPKKHENFIDLGTQRPSWLPKYLEVAPDAQYDENLGFFDSDGDT